VPKRFIKWERMMISSKQTTCFVSDQIHWIDAKGKDGGFFCLLFMG